MYIYIINNWILSFSRNTESPTEILANRRRRRAVNYLQIHREQYYHNIMSYCAHAKSRPDLEPAAADADRVLRAGGVCSGPSGPIDGGNAEDRGKYVISC